RLWYLRHDLEGSVHSFWSEDPLEYQSYDAPESRGRFHGTLLRSYEGTLDCPEVNGVRTLDEGLAGHRAQGQHDPRPWRLARAHGGVVGVLLLTEMPEWRTWDVSYVGIVPEARGRGLGRTLMRKALWEARSSAVRQLTLSVDTRNLPACHLYLGLGFEL